MTTLLFLLTIYFSQPDAPTEKNNPSFTSTPVSATATENKYGYWVIRPIPGIVNRVMVLYFNEKDELVKKEWRLPGEVDTTKGKVVRSLKRSLHEALKFCGAEEWN